MAVKVFISWSGTKSGALAEAVSEWIPSVIQAAEPYYSPDDVDKGSRWIGEISGELDASNVGLLCLTRDNLQAPWLLFEAGALSKRIDEARVCPILFGLEPTALRGPLQQFQAAKFDRTDMRRVVKMINGALGPSSLSETVLENVFNALWNDFETTVSTILDEEDESNEPIRSQEDMLAEVLELSRTMSHAILSPQVQTDSIRRLIDAYRHLVAQALEEDGTSLEIILALQNLHKPTLVFAEQLSSQTSRGKNAHLIMLQIGNLLEKRRVGFEANEEDFDDISF